MPRATDGYAGSDDVIQFLSKAASASIATLAALSFAFFTTSYFSVAKAADVNTSEVTPNIPNYWSPHVRTERPATNLRRIRFLTSDDFPPFSFRDPAGRITGFNVDLARAICEELDVACTLRVKPFDALVETLNRDEGDAIIAGLSTGDPAHADLAFTESYLKFPARFAQRRADAGPITPENFAGKWISVVEGTQHEAFVRRFFTGSLIASYPDAEKARAALRNGDVDAHFGDGLSLSFWLQGSQSRDCCAFSEGAWIEPNYFANGLAIAVRKDTDDLRDAINFALQQIHARGRYAELYLRYFPISFY
ncbi:transporter substrate-binding domain-containing protein [Breoghania sp. L-A4]|uniref:transporter substrate-binding domain-containing protein n=1 Tax=Breoghania sp. L-A4 TaxID=2304600 RepID=UPI000E35D441|nr:transporter substrate-binding domain-containing protein [Breoghania sp. L-A4]AXS42462.1 amino acid ABC transporter substrate-binding protein [Breoghania sp. L-A4]